MKKKKNNPVKEQVISSKTAAKNGNTPKWFYLILIIIPTVFIVLLEVLLRTINYGLDFKHFAAISEYHPDKYYPNPDLPYKYFYNIKSAPSVLPDGFDIIKKENAFRVFVLGGSSVAGWPYVPNASFSRQLKRKLELFYPENTIEVINCGISAINSYTLRDFVPGILEQKPDLILIYAGHNEYYGALGAGSSVSIGNSRFLVNTYLRLRDFKTVQLIQNTISWIYGLFTGGVSNEDDKQDGETLMSRMIGESLIPLNSDIFNAGISQFEGNLDDILRWFKEAGVPVIIGNLTANLRDQKPLVSVKTEKLPAADEIYTIAQKTLAEGNIEKAKELFLYAKELDALRFRAPKKINDIIKNLAVKYDCSFIDIDSVFKSHSPNGIVGYNLTVDHLHPNIDGYRMIGNEFFNKMLSNNLLPKGNRINFTEAKADSILIDNFPFTRFDSTLAQMSIIILTGQYPFVPKGTPNYKMINYKEKDIVDSVSIRVINKEINWESAHAFLSEYYYKKGEYAKCFREIETVIAERPYYDIPYKDIISKLVDSGFLEDAKVFLLKLHKMKPDYFSYKWLGQIMLKQKHNKEALYYLVEAAKFKDADSQTYYNLAGAYYLNGDINSALGSAEKSVSLNPQNKIALSFYNQLKSVYNSLK
jgi:lysophospholipase L1-like esterase